jgi:hypothetical protein
MLIQADGRFAAAADRQGVMRGPSTATFIQATGENE